MKLAQVGQIELASQQQLDGRRGLPSQIGTFATGLTYYANGAVKGFAYGNGISHGMNLSSDGRQLPGEVYDFNVDDLNYTYDGNGFPLTISDSIGNQGKTLTFDSGNRLKTATASQLWGSTTFTYDTLDSLTLDATASVNTSFPPNGNNLPDSIKVGSTTTDLTWDGEGNLIQKGAGASATTLTFDSANELTSFKQGTNSFGYSYDGQGLRASHTSNTTGVNQQTDSVYDAAGRLVYESQTTAGPADRIFSNDFETPVPATQTTRYVYLGRHAIAKAVLSGSTTTTTYLHTDALGSWVVPATSMTACGRRNGQVQQFSTFTLLYGPNLDIVYLSTAEASSSYTCAGTSAHEACVLAMRSTTDDIVCSGAVAAT